MLDKLTTRKNENDNMAHKMESNNYIPVSYHTLKLRTGGDILRTNLTVDIYCLVETGDY